MPAVVSPVIEVVPQPFDVAAVSGAELVFTSANAVRAAAARVNLCGKRAWVVGPRTAEAARREGMDVVSADGDADALLALLCKAGPEAPLVHLRGVHTRGDIAGRLSAAGLPTQSVIVYDQRPRALTAEAVGLLAGKAPVLIPLYSPRTARLLGDACAGIRAPATVVAISNATASAWPHGGRMIICKLPNGRAMMQAIADAAAGSLVDRGPSG